MSAVVTLGINGDERELLLRLYEKSILKKAKYAAITRFLPDPRGRRCLDIGADNGVLSFLLRQRGGEWHSADLDDDVVGAIKKIVGEKVYRFDGGRTEFPDHHFDIVVIIDFLEHIHRDHEFIAELNRIMAPDGTLLVNVPHYKPFSPIRLLRLAVRLTDEKHGHVRPGYTLETLRAALAPYFAIEEHRTYSKFFVELFDVAISLFFDLAKRGKVSRKGNVVTGDDIHKHAKKFRFFSIVYPLVWCLAQLDRLLVFTSGYSLIVKSRRIVE